MSSLQQFNCCGVLELEGVSENVPDVLLESLDDRCPEFDGGEDLLYETRNIVITDIAQHRKSKASGWAFAAFITKNGLGTITGPSPAGKNPNTKNNVYVWVWTPNVRAVAKLLNAAQKRREKEAEDEDY